MIEAERVLLIDVLKILKRYSDEDHSLVQKEIIELLESEYDYEDLYPKRKKVKRKLDEIIKYSLCKDVEEILYEENDFEYKVKVKGEHGKKTKTENRKGVEYTDYRYIHEFTQAELRLIIDSILFSKQIPTNQREELIEKLQNELSSVHFNSRLNHISMMDDEGPINYELFANIEVLDEAITKNKQVTFQYMNYEIEAGKLVLNPRRNSAGAPRHYTMNPYQMVASNGRYYLICNNDAFDGISHYRLDRITKIEKADGQRKPIRKIKGFEHGLNLVQYMKEHIYMYAGKSRMVHLRLDKRIVGDFVDWFGRSELDYFEETETEISVRVKVNYNAVRRWALQYGTFVTVLSPEDLVEDVKKDIHTTMKRYGL